MSKINTDIGGRIALLRKENHITQADLAEAIDISVKHCSEVERGVSGLSLEKLISVCNVFSTDLEYLIRGNRRVLPEESNVPSYVIELFNLGSPKQKALLEEYLLLFKKMSAENFENEQ